MTQVRGWVLGAVWVVLLTMGLGTARAQEVSGSITGTIVDPTGASVNGAVVTVTNTDRSQVERTVKTDKAGFYSASSLPLGNYSVTVAAKGFKTASETGLVLNANGQLKVDQKLAVGSASENVTIVANQAQINLENGMSEGLVTGTQIRELVLNNRNYEQLLTLQPGVSYGGANDQLYIGASLPSGSSNQVAFSINGQRATANNWTVDGADNVDRGSNLTLLGYPSVDAISEFVTLRGTYLAEYGRSSSGQVNVVTRSGTNSLHGSAYEFFRNDVFNANNYFNKVAGYTPRPRLRYNDFGFTLGGPVVIPHFYNGRNKTFFFYSMEFRRVVNYGTTTTLVPTQAERAGNFTNSYLSNGSTAPVAVCQVYTVSGSCTQYTTQVVNQSPTALAYLKDIYGPNGEKVPLPPSAADLAAGLDPHTLTSNVRNIFNDTQEFARIDQSIGKKINVFYHYLHDSLPSQEGLGFFASGGGLPGVQNTSSSAPGTQHLGHMTIAAKPTLLIDMGYAYSSGAIISNPVGLAASAASPDINPVLPNISTLGIVPAINYSGNASAIGAMGIYNDYDRNHNGFGDITKTFGQHTMKFGITYNHYQKTENALGNGNPYPQGAFNFNVATAPTAAQLTALSASTGTTVVAPSAFDSTFANFLIGNANSGFTQASAALTPSINENLVELYAQDDWRATRRLTVNLGVRYSYFGQPYDDNNQLSNFDPASYTQANAETIDSNGQLCTTLGQTTAVTNGATTTYTINNCANANGLNSYQPNPIADPLDGIILGRPIPVPAFNEPAQAPSTFLHGSPFGLEVGHAEKHDFAPRVGFAWDVFGNGKTAFRGGYGIAYDESQVGMYEQSVFHNVPYVNVTAFTAAPLDNPAGGTAAVNLAPPSLYATPVTYQTPYVQQFSLDVQQALSPTTILDIGYFGDHGTHLQGIVDINEVKPGAFTQTSIGYAQVAGCSAFTNSSCEAPLNQIRPFPGYTAINSVQTIFNSNYNSLQVKFTKKFSGQSLLDVNYTWSRALTDAQTDGSTAPQNTYNLAAEYGRSQYDRSNILTVDGIFELPWYRDQHGLIGHVIGGWEVSGIYALNSGLPLTAFMGGGGTISYGGIPSVYNPNFTNGGVANDAAGLGILGPSAASLRPNQVLNPNSGYGKVNLHTRLHWFNPTAFVAPSPASFQVGNEKRGTINGPGFNRLDVGLFRNFRVYRDAVFQLRGEAFNVANHTNWAGVNTTATSPTFGQVFSTRDPRLLQVAGKITF